MTIAADLPSIDAGQVVALRASLEEMRRNCLVHPEISKAPTARLVLDAALLDTTEASVDVLEALTRKVEVGRELRIAYKDGLGAAISGERVHVEIARYLAALFVFAGLARADWKFLNAALKMEGGILNEGRVELPEPFERTLRHVLGESLP